MTRLIAILALIGSTANAQEFTIVTPVVPFTIVEIVQSPKPARREWYLVSEPWCSHCPAAKRVFLSKGWPEANVITIDECERRFKFRPGHVPFEFGDPNWTSTTTTKTKTTGTTISTTTRTTTRMSHGAMVDLHNRLHGGRWHWSWPGDLATHLRQSHGVSINPH